MSGPLMGIKSSYTTVVNYSVTKWSKNFDERSNHTSCHY